MLRSILVLLLLVSSATRARAVEWETEAKQICTLSGISNCDGVATEVIAAVKAAGYRCDSVSSLRIWKFGGRGFTMKCSKFAYEYEFRDRGGRWELTLKD
jgi:hypothetical protein